LIDWLIDQYCAISGKQCKIQCALVLFTNRKSHTGFRLVQKSVTLNDLERCNDRRLALSLRSLSFLSILLYYCAAVLTRVKIDDYDDDDELSPKVLMMDAILSRERCPVTDSQ